jgi:SPP1 family predicted phage head-tail adaptor
MSLAAGQLDQRVTIQRPVAGQDAAGQPLTTWEDLAATPTVWAASEPLRGKEFIAAGQMQATVDTRFRIRHRSDVDSSMRVVWRGVPYQIVGVVEPSGAKESLELMCVRGRDA